MNAETKLRDAVKGYVEFKEDRMRHALEDMERARESGDNDAFNVAMKRFTEANAEPDMFVRPTKSTP